MTTRETTRLADMCDLTAEPVRPGTRPEALYLGLEHLASGRLVRIGGGRASEMRSTTSAFQADDVLYGKLRPYLDKAILADEPGVCTTELLVLRAKANVDPRFLAVVLHSRGFLEYAVAGTTGVQHPRTSWAHIREYVLPALTLTEQQRIANLLWLVHGAISRSEKLVDEGQALKRAAMQTLFTRGLRGEAQKETEIGPVPGSWKPKNILELCEIWSGGTPRKSVREYWGGKIPWVSGKDLKSPSLDDAIDHVTAEGVEAGSRVAPTESVLLLVRGMGLAKDLPVAVINRPMAFNQDVKALVSRGDYPGRFLRSAIYEGKARLLNQIVSSAHGTMTLNLNDVENFKVPCPPDAFEAEEIVAVLDAIDRKIDLHCRKHAVLDELFKTLLHKLMTGEIRAADLVLSALRETALSSQTFSG